MGSYDVFTIIASAASVVSLLYVLFQDLRQHKYRSAFHIVLVASLIVAAGVLAFTNYRAGQLERELLAIETPRNCDFDFYSNGQQCGFVLAALAIFERHRQSIPETYSVMASRQKQACEAIRGGTGTDAHYADKAYTEHAAAAMCQAVVEMREREIGEKS